MDLVFVYLHGEQKNLAARPIGLSLWQVAVGLSKHLVLNSKFSGRSHEACWSEPLI